MGQTMDSTIANVSDRLEARLEAISNPDALGAMWLDLQRRADCSFFQSWAWIGGWLRCLPPGLDRRALVVSRDDDVVGLGVLVANRRRRYGVVPSAALFLNETGDPGVDPISLEYNGILADRRCAGSVVRFCLAWLAERETGWDELTLGGMTRADAEACAGAARETGLMVRIGGTERYDYVDLAAVRNNGGDYLGLLSANTRYQIRRALRRYDGAAAPAVETAGNIGQAMEIFDDLKRLHQASWVRRGQPGAFASSFFDRFHRDLIATHFDSGEIQLMRMTASGKLIGCLYNFVKDRRVYAYQSGFAFDTDPRLKPGLVSHTLAIGYNLARGAGIYDFMAGESQHKRSLGTNAAEMTWLVIQRRRFRFRVENGLRSLWHMAKREERMRP